MSNDREPLHPTQRIVRHEGLAASDSPNGAAADPELIDLVSGHVERCIGPVSFVLHEQQSEGVHIDIHCVAPTPDRNIWTLVTSGMAQRPMLVPDDLPDPLFAELVAFLPPRWPLSAAAFSDESNYWPVRWLRLLARFPHRYHTWLGYGHTIPNGDPPHPFAPNTRFSCMLIAPVLSAPEEFCRIERPLDRDIHLFAMQPLYADEMAFKLAHGTDALLDRFDACAVDDIIDVGRRSVCGGSVANESDAAQ